MKKMVCLILSLMLILCALPAPAEMETAQPEVVPAQSMEDFIGTWQAAETYLDSVLIPPEALGSVPVLVVGETEGTLTYVSNGENISFKVSCALTEDGILETKDSSGYTMLFRLLDNGTITLIAQYDGHEMVQYFARVEEDE